MNERISIIVPVYNSKEYVEACLDSIINQTYPHTEILVVDDGSTDGSAEVLDTYAMQHSDAIRVFHIPNGGVTNARLTGIRQAKGDWIGFVDGDDYIEPDMYERLLENAHRYHADIAHCGYRMVFDDGRIHWFYNTGRLEKQDTATGLRDLLSGAFVEPSLCNKLFRRELFEDLLRNDCMPKEIKNNEDLLMNFLLFREAKTAVYEDFCPYHYMARQGSATRKTFSLHKIYDPIRVKEHIVSLAPEEIISDAQIAYITTCINMYNDLFFSDKKQAKEHQKTIRGYIRDHYEWVALLRRKQRMMATLINRLPKIYHALYGLYAAYFLKRRYE